MKIKHLLGSEKRQKETGNDRSFLLGNDHGDYLWLGDLPESRYQGWFIADRKNREKVYKIIEDIRPVGRSRIEKIENKLSLVTRKGTDFEETFSLDSKTGRFFYNLSEEKEIEIVLDIRDSYSDDYPEYKIEKVDDLLLITRTNDYNIYLAIKGFSSFKKVEERFVRNYNLDKERNSPPFEKAVFKALIISGQEISFSASTSREEAVSALGKGVDIKKYSNRREPLDFVVAEKGLDNLVVDSEKIYAGFPWFFQFWKRDEAISLRGLDITSPEKAKNVFLSLINEDSRGPRGNKIGDGFGWTFKRAFLFLDRLSKEEESNLVELLRSLTEFNPEEPLKITDSKETWMDSISREGARIEIQALQLSMYKLGKIIDANRKKEYERLESELKQRVRDIFWDGSMLADGYLPEKNQVDKTVRPNVFLSYYIYPDLLEENEWKTCFRRALYELWLDWGGLATISKESPRFKEIYTGENPESYHQGDSWFFVNNLSAIAMHRLDDGRFSNEINQILKASREDLLWRGAIGHHSEISSAKEQRAEGAISQAWSFATYLEALHEVFKIKNSSWN